MPATAQSDLYSVGIILYELLTGRIPFDGESAVAIAVQHLNDQPAPIHSLRPDVAPELEAAVMGALAKDPASRWADADEFIRALEGARAGLAAAPLGQDTAAFLPVVTDGDGPAEEREEERKLRWPWLALGLTALLIALALLFFTGGRRSRSSGWSGNPRPSRWTAWRTTDSRSTWTVSPTSLRSAR